MNAYRVWRIVWDVCKKPLYRDEMTNVYRDTCLQRGLPLLYTEFYIKAEKEEEVQTILEKKYNTKMRMWCMTHEGDAVELDKRWGGIKWLNA